MLTIAQLDTLALEALESQTEVQGDRDDEIRIQARLDLLAELRTAAGCQCQPDRHPGNGHEWACPHS